jgi:uncharacterized membrane protein HdeD (DUF308 family)
MANVTGRPSLGMTIQEIRGDWGGFVVLGVALMIAGANLFVATSASILYIGAMILAGGVVEFVDAFTVAGWRCKSLRLLAGAVYGLAGAVAVLEPLLASVGLTLALGIPLCCVGALRISFGLQHQDEKGRFWIVAAGTFTLIAGIVVLTAWPGICLWLLGAILTVDLILQGWSLAALGSGQHWNDDGGPRSTAWPAPLDESGEWAYLNEPAAAKDARDAADRC